jgi:hypothetical protein
MDPARWPLAVPVAAGAAPLVDELTSIVIPEPAALARFAAGLLGLTAMGSRKPMVGRRPP